MKHCPDCGYDNPDGWTSCEICRADITGVAALVALPQVRHKRRLRAWAAALSVLVALSAAASVYYGIKRYSGNGAKPAVRAEPAARGPSQDDVALLLKNMASPSPATRAQAADALGIWLETGAAEVDAPAQYMLAAMADPSYSVRSTAAMRLGMILETARLQGADGKLSWTRDAGFQASLKAETLRLLSEPSEAARENAAFLAGAQRDARFVPVLERVMERDADIMVRLAAAGALVKLGSEEGSAFLVLRAGDPDETVRQATAQYLAYCDSSSAEAALSAMSADPDDNVRSSASMSSETRKNIFSKRAGK